MTSSADNKPCAFKLSTICDKLKKQEDEMVTSDDYDTQDDSEYTINGTLTIDDQKDKMDEDSDSNSDHCKEKMNCSLSYEHQKYPVKNKRKNFQPRNIVYQCQDSDGENELLIDYYEDDKPPSSPDSEASVDSPARVQTAPVGIQGFKSSLGDQPLDLSEGPYNNPNVPVDLTWRRDSETDQEGAAMDLSTNLRESTSPNKTIREVPDASMMKDYAETTMKELLGMYGLNDVVESITKNVPLQNFSSGKILESMPAQHLPYMMPLSNLAASDPHFGEDSPPNCKNSRQSPPMQDSILQQSEECLQSSVVDSMSQLPSDNIIGNPKVILPQNMATTILTLAALGTKVTASPASTKAGSTPGTPTSPQGTSNQKLLINASNTMKEQQKPGPIDYSRYVKRFSSALECGSNYCKDLNYREHFHCLDCNSKVFVKKEEMIRHFKWHKKRDESLQHGFMRYSPMDDCSDKFTNCSHNRKQTHYHCLKEGCDKVYISTSDVQMHANYHRKDSAIIQEGFQRFRATEDCASKECSFHGQRTTHFHCRRPGCSFTFKNKADMEKHKTYHIKDEQLNKDGFKKFMKQEHCTFENCRFSRVCNHIHCIRPGCTYVLHSSGQLYSHKRKHERRDNELAYGKFKLAQSMIKSLSESGMKPSNIPEQISSRESSSSPSGGINCISLMQTSMPHLAPASSPANITDRINGQSVGSPTIVTDSNTFPETPTNNSMNETLPHSFARFASLLTGVNIVSPFNMNLNYGTQSQVNSGSNISGTPSDEKSVNTGQAVDLRSDPMKETNSDLWKKYLTRYGINDICKSECEYICKEHYHCKTDNCHMVFKGKDILGVQEHASNHEQQDQVTESFYNFVQNGQMNNCSTNCPYQNKEKHYHCTWEGCTEVISCNDKPFRRLDHYKIHEYSRKINYTHDQSPLGMASSIDGVFKRKRGRPPKNRIIEFPMSSTSCQLPQAIYTSFKLPKPSSQQQPISFGPFSPTSVSYAGIHPPTLLPKTTNSISLLAPPSSSVALLTSISPPYVSLPTSANNLTLPMLNQSVGIIDQKSIDDDSILHHSPPETGQLKQETFSNFLRLKPHVTKHCGAVSPVPIYCGSGGSPESSPSTTLPGEDGLDEREGTTDDDEGKDEQCNIIPDSSFHEANMLDSGRDELKIAMPSLYTWQAMTSGSPPVTLQSPPSYVNSAEISEAHLTNSFINRSSSFITQSSSDVSKKEKYYGSPQVDFSAHVTETDCLDQTNKLIRKRTFSEKHEDVTEPKKIKLTSLRILKDEPVPSGYVRYRFNEDCGYTFCGYREHQTHFHCMRKDCGYSFCDKTRFVQHTARHERLDTLMGGDFQQYRANVNCGRSECIYANTLGAMANKSSHFHCIKCDFVCTDTNKVVAHRRQHTKMDSISAAGFEKFTPSQNCNVQGCNHNQRQTHYHCMKCQYAVLGLSQMSSHKYRHME